MPYEGRTPEEVSAAHAAGVVRPPSELIDGVPGRLDDAILQALRRDPASRFHSADAMARALGAAGDEAMDLHEADETRVIAVPGPSPDVRPASAATCRHLSRPACRLLGVLRPDLHRHDRRAELVCGRCSVRCSCWLRPGSWSCS